MKKLLTGMVCLGVWSSWAYSYKEPTHEVIAKFAFNVSDIVSKQEVRASHDIWSLKQAIYLNSDGKPDKIESLVGAGAVDEDAFPRSLYHFYNPVTDKGLGIDSGSFSGSPDWALEDQSQDFIFSQYYSHRDAKTYYLEALLGDAQFYEYWMGVTFKTIGQVIHHIEDMAQPEHVRNDPHLVIPISDDDSIPFDPSLYESYTDDLREEKKLSSLLNRAYPPVSLPLPRDYWKSSGESLSSSLGIAAFTNRSFVSKDTNFFILNGEPATNPDGFDLPQPGSRNLESLEDLMGEDGTALCNKLRNDPHIVAPAETVCYMEFISSTGNDAYIRQEFTNDRASSLSVLDQEVHSRQLKVKKAGGKATHYADVDRIVTLNKFNFDEFHKILLPRAVAYSTGLINYFFRGRLELEAGEGGIYGVVDHAEKDAAEFTKLRVRLKNASSIPSIEGEENPELSGGTLKAVIRYITNPCYSPDLSGEIDLSGQIPASDCDTSRYVGEAKREISVSAPITVGQVGDSFTEHEFNFSDSPIPLGIRDVILQVVYEGKVADEEDGIAVGTRDISEPTYIAVFNNTDYYGIDGVLYSPDEIRQTPDLLDRVDLNGDGEPDYDIDPEPLTGVQYIVNGNPITETTTLEPNHFTRLAVLSENASAPFTPNIDLNVLMNIEQGGLQVYTGRVSALTTQFSRPPNAVSAIQEMRGTYQWSLIWFSKQLGDIGAPGSAFLDLPPLEEIPDPTSIPVNF